MMALFRRCDPATGEKMPLPFPGRLLIVAAAALPLLAGCGRRGPLEAPPGGAALPGNTSAVDEQAQGEQPVTVSPLGQSRPRAAPIAAPKRPFILDPIL
jgi:predicted small lipoprotein YifL